MLSKKMKDYNRIINHLIMNSSRLEEVGLFNGKIGIAIFFEYYAKYSNSSICNEFANVLLEEALSSLYKNMTINFESGLSGVGWGVLHLLENNFVEEEANDIFEEIDQKIMEYDIRRYKDMSLETGLEGISYYIHKRIDFSKARNLDKPFDEKFIMEWKSIYTKQIPSDKKILLNIIDRSSIKDKISEWNLGLHNGCAGFGLKELYINFSTSVQE